MNTDTIQIWHGNIAADNAHYQNYWRVLDAAEHAHAEKIKNDLLHKRYVEVHGRLRNILAQTLNQPPEQINIKKTEHGKPYLADMPELVFNLSHSASVMVIALGWNCQLGVDIECCKPRTSLAGLVDKCFAEEEIAYWHKLPEAQKTPEFYRFWTRKEAFVKATGRGIGLGLNRCVINPQNQSEFLRVPADYGQASTWHVQDITLGQDVCSALVTDKGIVEIRLIELAVST
ncbi:MAG: 4'-phosphopantetheinyl transferase superfamily protein [Methylobacter sp.]|uniref:4'-phosphopantetheinyl transferase family protein n=1 Tax=Methylobacter sp. TaxID=2051955 RepID=UPI002731B6A4|nr:4'-phosphopantetheinyl transferase superfamily protein [Methylobacter sp.]MDP1665228.1 4'-phosphopantetheinyl transferase superfamily protein [Methylobacter sp.]MDP1969869.1 4'-phosphopantetheinyl transferase superfamily protein [Methylobacter sp.]